MLAANDFLTTPLKENNSDPRVACIVLADVSGSMSGAPLEALNTGFAHFVKYLQDDPLARKRAEVGVVAFGSNAEVLVPIMEGRDLSTIAFQLNGSTNMAEGIGVALDMLQERKAQYQEAGLEYYRPWLLVFTDGSPDRDGFDTAVERLNGVERDRGVAVFPVGVGGSVDFVTLGQLSTERPPLSLDGLKFAEMFEWLSKSLSSVSQSRAFSSDGGVGTSEQVHLPPPTWTTV